MSTPSGLGRIAPVVAWLPHHRREWIATDAPGRGHMWHSISQTVNAAGLFVAGKPLPDLKDAVHDDTQRSTR